MIKEHVVETVEKGERQENINICLTCSVPMGKCNGECSYYFRQAKKLRQSKKLKKSVVVY